MVGVNEVDIRWKDNALIRGGLTDMTNSYSSTQVMELANTVYFTLSILSYSEYSSSHPPLTCLCVMLQNRQSKLPYKGNTARISKAKSLPNHSTTKFLHFLTSY